MYPPGRNDALLRLERPLPAGLSSAALPAARRAAALPRTGGGRRRRRLLYPANADLRRQFRANAEPAGRRARGNRAAGGRVCPSARCGGAPGVGCG